MMLAIATILLSALTAAPADVTGTWEGGLTATRSDGTNHAAMKAGSNVVMMGRPPKAYHNPKRLGQATQCLLVDVRGVDAHFQRAIKAGARVLQEPADTPFGTRRYGVTDPEGHEWYFSQSRRTKRAATR